MFFFLFLDCDLNLLMRDVCNLCYIHFSFPYQIYLLWDKMLFSLLFVISKYFSKPFNADLLFNYNFDIFSYKIIITTIFTIYHFIYFIRFKYTILSCSKKLV